VIFALKFQLSEEMKYGKPIDPFNFRLALRHLKVKFTKNGNKVTEFVMTFNNSNQMLWRGSDNTVMQVIKFDGKQMMVTICDRKRGEIYTILASRGSNDDKKQTDTNSRLILQGRNLKVHSKYSLRADCDAIVHEHTTKAQEHALTTEAQENVITTDAYSSGQFHFRAVLPLLVMLFVASAVIQ
jgi:hypothetical protein